MAATLPSVKHNFFFTSVKSFLRDLLAFLRLVPNLRWQWWWWGRMYLDAATTSRGPLVMRQLGDTPPDRVCSKLTATQRQGPFLSASWALAHDAKNLASLLNLGPL